MSPDMMFGRIVDGKFVADGPVAVRRGKPGCTNIMCTQYDGKCYGWHCLTCGEPTDAQGGHRCLGPTNA